MAPSYKNLKAISPGLGLPAHFPCRKFEKNTEPTARNGQKMEVGVVLSNYVWNSKAGFDSWPHHIKIWRPPALALAFQAISRVTSLKKNTELTARNRQKMEVGVVNITFLLWQRQASKYLVRFEENPANVTFLLWQRQASKYLVRLEENPANVTFLLCKPQNI